MGPPSVQSGFSKIFEFRWKLYSEARAAGRRSTLMGSKPRSWNQCAVRVVSTISFFRANVQDPQIEGRDIKTLLDWAEGALTPHLAYLRGDPLVGGIGLSYGGGFQLIGAGVDPRFDALVPMITWNDLSYSLTPGTVPKTLWLTFLSAIAIDDQAPWVTQAYAQSLGGNVDESTRQRLAGHGLGAFCGMNTPRVDATSTA